MSIAEEIIDGELCPLCVSPEEVCDCSPEAIKSAGGHLFVALRANVRREREEAWEKQIKTLRAEIDKRNAGHHWIITRNRKRWDFWPSRQKYRGPSNPRIQRGFDQLIEEIQNEL